MYTRETIPLVASGLPVVFTTLTFQDVREYTPKRDPDLFEKSIEVLLYAMDGEVYIARYDYGRRVWYYYSSEEDVIIDPYKWAYLPRIELPSPKEDL